MLCSPARSQAALAVQRAALPPRLATVLCVRSSHLNGKDLRNLPLIEQKRALRKVVPISSPVLIFVDHIEGRR
jgi:hypothetical protein